MQHVVGAPLPPPHDSGQSWAGAPGASGPAGAAPHPPVGPPAPQGPPLPPHTPPQAPAPPHAPAPAPGFNGNGQGPVAPQPQPYSGPGPGAGPGPQHAPVPSGARDTTGHIQLPPGGPVPLPQAPGAPGHAGTGTTTLAVLLIGPAGAGKTTVAKYWAQSRRVPTAHISLDDVREWVCSGFADPQGGWNDHSEAQYRLARRTCGFAARNFLANNISCIVDDAVFPDWPVVGLGGWKRHVGPGLLPVVLLPGLEVVLERNAKRSGNRRLSDEEVARIHGRMAGWYGSGLPIIDNSQFDVPTTARLLDETLARAMASPPTW
ncbi:AAA family ATPase [Streptomyces sp. NPDC087440]|uniref:AAA family ATPase n=1 Tax=Streptomyces sp. NPDC087440 TaxID=3365790 RepID=UPI00381E4C11